MIPTAPRWTAALIALLAAATPASAQQDTLSVEEPPDRWKVVLDLSFTGSSGNNEMSMLAAGARATHLVTAEYELEASLQTRYGHSEGREVARSAKGGLSFDLHPEDRWSPFLTLELERDPFRRLDLRSNGGGGMKYTLIDTERAALSLSSAAIYSYEDLAPAEDGHPGELSHLVRSSWRYKGMRAFGDGASVEQVVWYQPLWDLPSDYLMRAETALGVQMTEGLFLRLVHSFQRDSTPPPEVEPDDHVVTMGISIQM